MRSRNPGTDADYSQVFSDGGRVEVWNDGEVCVYDPMDRDLDDYYVVPADVPKIIRLLGSPLARWHHFMRDMVEDDVTLVRSTRRRRKNPDSFHAQIRAILTKARSNPMSRLRRKARKSRRTRGARASRRLTRKQLRAKRKAAWRKAQAKRRAKKVRRAARMSRKSRYSRKARRTIRRTSRGRFARKAGVRRGRKSRRSTKSRYSRKARRSGRGRRRNPGTHHFKGGMVSYQDDGQVTLTNDYGQTREYELDSRGLRNFIPKVRKLKSWKGIERALGSGAILRQVNPKRRRRNSPLRRRHARSLKAVLRSHGYKCNPRRGYHNRYRRNCYR